MLCCNKKSPNQHLKISSFISVLNVKSLILVLFFIVNIWCVALRESEAHIITKPFLLSGLSPYG